MLTPIFAHMDAYSGWKLHIMTTVAFLLTPACPVNIAASFVA